MIFKSSNKRNYDKEAVNHLLQYYYLFSDRQREHLLWSRCINTRGYQGANIPCDRHTEHLNRRLKTSMRNLRANVKPYSIVKAGKCIAAVHHVCEEFENQTSSHHISIHHPVPDFGKYFVTIVNALDEESIFVPKYKRQYRFLQLSLHTKLPQHIPHLYQLFQFVVYTLQLCSVHPNVQSFKYLGNQPLSQTQVWQLQVVRCSL